MESGVKAENGDGEVDDGHWLVLSHKVRLFVRWGRYSAIWWGGQLGGVVGVGLFLTFVGNGDILISDVTARKSAATRAQSWLGIAFLKTVEGGTNGILLRCRK